MKSLFIFLRLTFIRSLNNNSSLVEDCGYYGISEDECLSRKCLWDMNRAPGAVCYTLDHRTCSIGVPAQTECGYMGINESQCLNKGCCWQPKDNKGGYWCYNKRKDCKGYAVTKVVENESSVEARLKINNKDCHEISVGIEYLNLKVDYVSDTTLRIRLTDANNMRYEIPQSILKNNYDNKFTLDKTNRKFKFEYTDNPFTFRVLRNSDNEVMFDTNVDGMESLVYQNQYLELSTKMPTDANVYGMSQVVSRFRRDPNNTLQALWNIDSATPVDENVYGSHPFYMELRNSKAHGVFMRNSNAMDMQLSHQVMTYKIIGGIIDLFIFTGDQPKQVVEQYTDIVGKPQMVSYWSLGFQQCRYGYKNLDEVKTVVERFRQSNIPLEVVWIDIDYLNKNKDFEFDEKNFPVQEIKLFVDELHKNNQKFVLILDPAIKVEKGYDAYETGIEQNVFVKNQDDKPFVGKVWPGEAVFPDFFNPNATKWWTKQLNDLINKVPVDGLWIDMNEPSSFCNGDCNAAKNQINQLNNPPYNIYNANKRDPLNTKTLNPDTKHHGYYHYDVHNLYGITESIATYESILKINPDIRPFVLSRSTFSGSGKYAGNWLGDNWSKWEYIHYSISGMLSAQIYGIPYVGSDICGFVGESNEELCLRWMQVGAFYPFSRNHNAIDMPSQEPYIWENVAKASRLALNIRYNLLPHYYTLFYKASIKGTPVIRPMLFEFSNDVNTIDIDKQFLIGDSILVVPVIEKDAMSVQAYLPNSNSTIWYNYHTLSKVELNGWSNIKVDLFSIPMFVRGGRTIFTQHASKTTHESKNNKFRILIALDTNNKSEGEIYLDEGNRLNQKYSLIKINTDLSQGFIQLSGIHEYTNNAHIIDELVIAKYNDIKFEKAKITSTNCGNRVVENDELVNNKTHLIIKVKNVSMNCDWKLILE